MVSADGFAFGNIAEGRRFETKCGAEPDSRVLNQRLFMQAGTTTLSNFASWKVGRIESRRKRPSIPVSTRLIAFSYISLDHALSRRLSGDNKSVIECSHIKSTDAHEHHSMCVIQGNNMLLCLSAFKGAREHKSRHKEKEGAAFASRPPIFICHSRFHSYSYAFVRFSLSNRVSFYFHPEENVFNR